MRTCPPVTERAFQPYLVDYVVAGAAIRRPEIGKLGWRKILHPHFEYKPARSAAVREEFFRCIPYLRRML